MAAHGYIPLCQRFLSGVDRPNVLEIGVDRGVMFLTLMHWLVKHKPEFMIVGIDVKIQDSIPPMIMYVERAYERQHVIFVEDNSLRVLPKIVEHGTKFDLVLIDGDHNYHTVSQELQHVNELTHPGSFVIIDDYDGRWSNRDLWYAERPDYEACEVATKRVSTEKHGVKSAVDEFLDANPSWKMHKPIKGEPVLLTRADVKFTNA